MVAYNKGDLVPEGTKVRAAATTYPYSGKAGIVVSSENRQQWATLRPGTRMTWVLIDGRDTPFGFYTDNLERIEDVNSNLVGPKPEPIKEPEFPTPWKSDGADILDANGKVVTRVQFGGYTQGTYRSELPVSHKYELARVIAEAVTKYYAEPETSRSPF